MSSAIGMAIAMASPARPHNKALSSGSKVRQSAVGSFVSSDRRLASSSSADRRLGGSGREACGWAEPHGHCQP